MSDDTQPWEGTATGRADRGLFARGNQISRGHQGNRRMSELRQSILSAASEDDVQAIIRKMAEMGRTGDVMAARVFLEYVVGKPVQALELSNADGSAIELTSVVATIMVALGDDPAARAKVAAAFRRLGAQSTHSAQNDMPT
jgi:hypothetical protein